MKNVHVKMSTTFLSHHADKFTNKGKSIIYLSVVKVASKKSSDNGYRLMVNFIHQAVDKYNETNTGK